MPNRHSEPISDRRRKSVVKAARAHRAAIKKAEEARRRLAHEMKVANTDEEVTWDELSQVAEFSSGDVARRFVTRLGDVLETA